MANFSSLLVKFLLILMFFISVISIFADENETVDSGIAIKNKNHIAAIGIGPEWNMNSRKNFALGAVFGLDFYIGSLFAAGLNSTFSANFTGFYAIEPAAMFRWYFLGRKFPDKWFGGWFFQAEGGVFLIFDNNEFSLKPLGGLRAGLRLPFGKMLYLEPFGRVGYPFMFGVGAAVGLRMPGKVL